jgi:ATP-dependent Clp protease ATP-binding subunit ClpB
MTSNMGSQIIQEKFENLKGSMEEATEAAKEVLALLKQTVRPEFINRIDEIVMFTPLSSAILLKLLVYNSTTLLRCLHYKELLWMRQVMPLLSGGKGYDPQFGQTGKTVIQRDVLNKLSKEILAGTIATDSIILLDALAESWF